MLYLVQDPLDKSDPLKVANVLSTIGPPMPKPNTPLSPFEISISRVSAGICVKAAHLQIESVHLFRKMKLTGAFWWNFYFTFNAICALSGALALGEEDRRVVLGSAGGLKGLIAKGFFDLQDMRKQTPMVERSEAFLRQLLKAAERTTGQQQETKEKEKGKKGKAVQSTKSIEIPVSIPDTTSVESSVPFPTTSLENMDPGFNFGEGFDELSINPLFGEDSPSLIDILAAAGPPNPEVAMSGLGGGGNGDLQSFEDLLQNSFDVWNFFQSPEMSSAQPQLWR
jgi:hypothetical protein